LGGEKPNEAEEQGEQPVSHLKGRFGGKGRGPRLAAGKVEKGQDEEVEEERNEAEGADPEEGGVGA